MLLVFPGSAWDLVGSSATILLKPVVTIISLMVITRVARRAGLFVRLLQMVMRSAGGDGRRPFFWLFGPGC